MSFTTHWLTIPAANTTANYPSDGVGGVTASPASAFTGSFFRHRYRVYGITCIASESGGADNTVTVKDSDGTTVCTLTLVADMTAGHRVSLPENAGQAAAPGSADVPLDPEAGIVLDRVFTVQQSNATDWTITVLFSVEVEQGRGLFAS